MASEASTAPPSISIRFWGVRGSIACPGASTSRYGGNTACVEVRCGDNTLIFDAGTGIRALGNALVQTRRLSEYDIFLSHGHIDHVVGLPFFAPLFVPGQLIRVWAGNLRHHGGVHRAVRKLMSFPLFPLQVDAVHAELEFHDFGSGDILNPQTRPYDPDGQARTSRRRHRIPGRLWRPLPRLCHGYRTRRRAHSILRWSH